MTDTNEKKVFAKGMSFFKLFWIFVIGCIIGTYYEQFLTLFLHGEWVSRQGVLYGPFNPVYGFGMMLIVWAFHNQKDWKRLLLYGAIGGGGFEYLLSFLQEFFIGSRSWDYDNHLLNINGRTTIPFALFWGLLTIIVVKFVYPFLSKWIEKIPYKFGNIFSIIFAVLLGIDMALTGAVLLRQGARSEGKAPYTAFGEWIDQVYTDDYLEKIFPNMAKQEDDNTDDSSTTEENADTQDEMSASNLFDMTRTNTIYSFYQDSGKEYCVALVAE